MWSRWSRARAKGMANTSLAMPLPVTSSSKFDHAQPVPCALSSSSRPRSPNVLRNMRSTSRRGHLVAFARNASADGLFSSSPEQVAAGHVGKRSATAPCSRGPVCATPARVLAEGRGLPLKGHQNQPTAFLPQHRRPSMLKFLITVGAVYAAFGLCREVGRNEARILLGAPIDYERRPPKRSDEDIGPLGWR